MIIRVYSIQGFSCYVKISDRNVSDYDGNARVQLNTNQQWIEWINTASSGCPDVRGAVWTTDGSAKKIVSFSACKRSFGTPWFEISGNEKSIDKGQTWVITVNGVYFKVVRVDDLEDEPKFHLYINA